MRHPAWSRERTGAPTLVGVSLRRRATVLAACSAMLLAACTPPPTPAPAHPDDTSSGTASAVGPAGPGTGRATTGAPATAEPTDNEDLARENAALDQPEFDQPLAGDVTVEELEELMDAGRLPVGPAHSGAFETMTNAMRLQPAHDVMLFGDSMTQQGIDPDVLGERLSELAGREVTVFNAGSSRARWGINRMVGRYAEHVDRLPDVAVLVISTRAVESDAFYRNTVQHSPFSHVVEGCDRPYDPETFDEADAALCEADRSDLLHRFRRGGGQVEWAREGNPLQQTLPIHGASVLRANGMIAHPGISAEEAKEASVKGAERGFPGFPTNHDSATAQYRDLVEHLRSRGVTVISTEIPYPVAHQQTTEEKWGTYDERRQQAAATLADQGGTEHFPVKEFGPWWGDGSSRDAIHLSHEGAVDFAHQLVDDVPGFAEAILAGLD